MPELAATLEEFPILAGRRGFIAGQLSPFVRVARSSGSYGILPIEQILKQADLKRAPGAPYNRTELKFETATFATEEFGLEEPIDDRERALYADYFDHDQIVAARLQHKVLEGLESAVAAAVKAGVSTTTGVSANWSTISADIIGDVNGAVETVRGRIGTAPDTMVVSWPKWRAMLRNTGIQNLIKYWGQDPNIRSLSATADIMAKAVGIDRILVADMVTNGAAEGQAASLSDIWDVDEAVLLKTAKTGDFREVTAVRIFEYLGDGAGVDESMSLEKYRDESIRGDVMRARNEYDVKVVYAAAGHRLTGLNQ
jgi:hypothetical protein